MHEIITETLAPDQAGIDRAVAIWRGGGLVAFPTETVYGLGADACHGAAVAAIYAAKGRPAFNPLIIHVADIAIAQRFARLDGVAADLADAFWPGPLSLVLPLQCDSGLSPLVTAGLDSVAVRVPENPLAQQLLRGFGGAIAAPSANPSGRISPTSAAHVLGGLAGKIDAVMDGGDCAVGLESTIVHAGGAHPALLRPGGLPVEAIEAMLGVKLHRDPDPDRPSAPGQLASHYAPSSAMRLNVEAPSSDALFLGFGAGLKADRNLSPARDLHEAAANLFGMLHELDAIANAAGRAVIEVAPIPDHGLGAAINDRLKRAAAKR
ncbi:MAG: threonylcarbamoyl-AMP synthase [Alphaproteobacteria bacterium]|nr:threonylcarbamoyl-AMP synthase [Alphaproteobacteria bacterium]